MVIEGGGLDWEGVVGMKEGETIDIVSKMNGGGKQMKKGNRNPRNSSGERDLKESGKERHRRELGGGNVQTIDSVVG